MKINKIILLSLIAGIMISCDFSETCHYTGKVYVKTNWKKTHGKRANMMETIFYGEGKSETFRFRKDTVLASVSAGQKRIIFFNRPKDGNAQFKGMENIETAEVILNTTAKNGRLYVGNAPTVFVDKQTLDVAAFDTTEVMFVPAPGIQTINFHYKIVNNRTPGVASINSELSGVATSYSLSKLSANRSDATIAFNSTLNGEEYLGSVQVLGLNPPVTGQAAIENILNMDIKMADGRLISKSVNMTEQLDKFAYGTLDITMELTVNVLDVDFKITNWETKEWGEINLKKTNNY